MRLPIVGPAYQHRSANVSAQRCVNLFPEMNEAPPGKEGDVSCLMPTPGLSLRTNLILGQKTQGVYVTSTGLFVYFIGIALIIEAADGSISIATLGDEFINYTYDQLFNDQLVSVTDNGQTLVWVNGKHGFYMNFNDMTAHVIEDPNFYPADTVAFLGGYFVFNRKDTGQFFISGLYDTSFDALDFATAEGSPDRLLTLVANNSELWLFGDNSVEVWYNNGDADFPFTRVQGAFIEYGCAALGSVAKAGGSLIWLGRDKQGAGVVVMNNGYTPQRISTHAIEQMIQNFGVLEDATAFTYQQDGHLFYVLNFTNANSTLVYDAATKLWHERGIWDTVNGTFDRHPASCHAYYKGQHIVGSNNTPVLYKLDVNATTDDGNPIVRLRSSPHVSKELVQVYYNSAQLDIQTGVGLDGGAEPGRSPQAMLRWSDDGGHTWSNEHWVSFGALGAYKARALWRRLGRSRDRVFEVRISDPVRTTILGMTIDVAAGGH